MNLRNIENKIHTIVVMNSVELLKKKVVYVTLTFYVWFWRRIFPFAEVAA